MSKFKQLINPHSHSHHSLDGAATVDQIVKRSKELGASYVSLTEHGNLNSAIDLYDSAKKSGLKPIIGIELYVEPFFKEELAAMIHEKTGKEGEALVNELKKHYTHLTIHFKDEWAYKYFCNLTPIMEERAIVKWGERKPICTLEELRAAAGHITICTGCLISSVHKWLDPLRDKSHIRTDLAERAYNIIREIAGPGSFFVEVFPHRITHNWKRAKFDNKTKTVTEPGKFEEIGCSDLAPEGDIQKTSNQLSLYLAKKYNDPVVISLDSHFATQEQKLIQDARLGNGMENWRFHESLHIMSTDEAAETLIDTLKVDEKTIEGWVDNSYKFASLFDNFKMTTSKDRWVLDKVPDDYKRRLVDMIQKHGRMNWHDPNMVKRLKYEIDVLADNGTINLIPYFFTIEDVAEYCRNNDILLNVRGSAGGSLLLYAIGVSAVNPLKHNLSFERFLTLGRIKAKTLPDADLDLPTGDIDKVIKYLEDKYGDRICRISVDIQLKIKSSLKDAERSITGTVSKDTEDLCKTIPKNMNNIPEYDFVFGYTDDGGVYHQGLTDNHEKFKEYITKKPKVWEMTQEMLGINRQKSQHPCGYVIADRPVQEYIPVTKVGPVKVTGFTPKAVEKAGLIKYDFLGLNTLKDIQGCLRMIRTRKGLTIDPWTLPQEKEVYEMFHRGETESVFQFDTDVVRPFLMSIKPTDLDGLASITALARPGTLDALDMDGRTLADVYVARAQGEPIRYVHPDMEPILKGTYGINVFQEQTIRIYQDIAGYTAEEAETVRRGIGKKDKKVLGESTTVLRERCIAKGWTEEQVTLLVDQIMASARYSFNQSHATSYAYAAYACMWLKARYPLEWWTTVLSNSSKDDLQKYWPHVSKIVQLPDINVSSDRFEIIMNDGVEKIRSPLNLIDGVGEVSVREAMAKRPFKDLDDFINRVDRRIMRKDIVYQLILAGAMDTVFNKELNHFDKIREYELRRAMVAGKKTPDEVPAWLLSMNSIQAYLMKKKVFKVYNEDIYNISMNKLLAEGLITQNHNIPGLYTYRDIDNYLNGKMYINHKFMEEIMSDISKLNWSDKQLFAIVGYVNKVKEHTYNGPSATNKSKTVQKRMLKLTVEIGHKIYGVVKFPDFKKDHHGIDRDIEGSICLFVLQKKKGGDLIAKKIICIS